MQSLVVTKTENPLLSNELVIILAGLFIGLISDSEAKQYETNNLTKYLLQTNHSYLMNNCYHLNNANKTILDIKYENKNQNTLLIPRKYLQNKTDKGVTFPDNVSIKLHLNGNEIEKIRLMGKSSVLEDSKILLSKPTNFNFNDYQFTHRKRRLPFKDQKNINLDCLSSSELFYNDLSNNSALIIKRSNDNEINSNRNKNFSNINNRSLIVSFKLMGTNNSDFMSKFNLFIDNQSIIDSLNKSSLKGFYRDEELASIAADGKPPKDNDLPQFILRQRDAWERSNPSRVESDKQCCDPMLAWADDICEAKARLRVFIGILIVAGILVTVIYFSWNSCIVKKPCQRFPPNDPFEARQSASNIDTTC